MTRRNLYCFLIAFVIILSLLVTFFSPYGVLVNLKEEKELERITKEKEIKETELEILREKEKSLYTATQEEGTLVLSFDEEVLSDVKEEVVKEEESKKPFTFPFYLDLIIAFFLSAIISLLPVFNKEQEKKVKERRNYDDYT